jgi:hypothetical protein
MSAPSSQRGPSRWRRTLTYSSVINDEEMSYIAEFDRHRRQHRSSGTVPRGDHTFRRRAVMPLLGPADAVLSVPAATVLATAVLTR